MMFYSIAMAEIARHFNVFFMIVRRILKKPKFSKCLNIRTDPVLHAFRQNVSLNICLSLCCMVGFLAGIFPLTVHGASFDCKKASTKIEKMICDDEITSLSDDDLDLSYLQALERTDNRQQLIDDQRLWMKTVRNVCQDTTCVFRANQERTDVLNTIQTHKCYWLEPPIKNDLGKRAPVEPICRVLDENLNQFCNEPPMVCGLKVAPKFKEKIIFPDWKAVANPNPAMIEELLMAPWANENSDSKKTLWNEQRPDMDTAFAEKRLKLSEAEIDLYNLGKAQTAYRLDYGNCEAINPQLKERQKWGQASHVANILTLMAPIIFHQLQKDYSIWFDLSREVFLYDGKIYFYGMNGSDNGGEKYNDNNFIVNRFREENFDNKRKVLMMKNTCIFNYRPVGGGSQ